MADMVKDTKNEEKDISPAATRAPFRALFIAALIVLAALAAVCGWLIFRQRALLDREGELDRQTVLLEQETDRLKQDLSRLEQELAGWRSDYEQQQQKLAEQQTRLEQQQTRLEEQQTQLAGQQALLEEQQLQLDRAQETIDNLSHYPPAPPDGEVPKYTSLYPDFYAPVWTGEKVTGGRVCYLTFDDGPSANTDRILEILDEYDVKATFFVIGSNATSTVSQERLRKIVAAGHTIGMHSWTHAYGTVYASVESFLKEFNQLYEWIYQVTGVHPTVFRFPGGSINGYNRGVYQEIIAEMTRRGFVYYDWNESAGDATATPRAAELIAQDCLKGIGRSLAVVLCHDNSARTTTVDALPTVIEGYLAAGYTFSALHPGVTPVTFGYPKIT